jgi:hypothetical protein
MSWPNDPLRSTDPNEPDGRWGPIGPPPGMPPGFDPLEQQSQPSRVAAPAIGMMIVSALSAIVSVVTIVLALLGTGLALPGLGGSGTMPGFGASIVANLSAGALGFALNLLSFGAAIQMRRLRSYSLCMAGSIAMLVPCGTLCCLANVGVGIWSLVVLADPTVKAQFR